MIVFDLFFSYVLFVTLTTVITLCEMMVIHVWFFSFLAEIVQEHLSYFHFVGRIMGLAVFHGHHLDGGFTLPFYKMLLNKPIVLDDITHVDPELHRSLTWMLYVVRNNF